MVARRLPLLVVLVSGMLTSATVAAKGQDPPPPPVVGPPAAAEGADSLGTDSVAMSDSLYVVGGPRPLGAFFRALAVPGWGHSYADAPLRGGIYTAFEVGSAYAILRTRSRVSEVDAKIGILEKSVRARLADLGITHSEYIENVLASDPSISDLRELKAEREQQVEDWVAFGTFMILLSAADAFVSTHLREVPSPLELTAAADDEGRIEVGVRVPVGGR